MTRQDHRAKPPPLETTFVPRKAVSRKPRDPKRPVAIPTKHDIVRLPR